MSGGTLPRGWRMASLAEVARTCAGGTPKAKTPAYYEGGDIPWLKIGDLNDGEVFESEQAITQAGFDASAAKWVDPGAVLVAMYGSIGKLGILRVRATTNQAICAVTPNPEHLTTEWLYWVLRSQRAALDRLGRGGTQRNISQGDLKTWPIPIPPITEQVTIVAAIKDAFAQIDAIEASAAEADALRRRLQVSSLREVVETDDEGWPVVALGDLTAATRPICYGVLKPGPDVDGGVPLIKVQDLVGGTVVTEKVQYISSDLDEEFKRSRLKGGEVLLSIQGTVGRVAICPPELARANISRTVAVIQPDDRIAPEYLAAHLEYTAERGAFSISGSTRASLNIGDIRKISFRIPPRSVQEMRLAHLRATKAMAADLAAQVVQVRELCGQLRASVLYRAFTGELLGFPQARKGVPLHD